MSPTLRACTFFLVLTSVALSARAEDNSVAAIQKRGVLRVCEVSYPPYNVKDPMTNAWSGLDVDIIKAVAADLKVKVEDVDSSFATVIPSLNTDKCDVSAAATYVTPARAEQVLFTMSYAADSKTVVLPAASTAKTVADIDKPGEIIAVRAGSSEEVYAKQLFKQATVRATTSDATQPHLMEVSTKRADAAFAGFSGAYLFLKQNPNLKLRIMSGVDVDPSPFAMMVPLGHSQLAQAMNKTIGAMQADGRLKALHAKWFPAQP